MSTFGCPHCGRSNRLGAPFCVYCGTNLQSVEPSDLWSEADEDEGASGDGDSERSSGELPIGEEAWTGSVPPPQADSPVEEADAPPDPVLDQPWLRPEADDDAPPVDEPNQPWLQPDREKIDVEQPPPRQVQRLLTGLQGLLEHATFADLPDDELRDAHSDDPPLSDSLRRELRNLFTTEVPLVDERVGTPLRVGDGARRNTAIYLFLFGGLLLAFLIGSPPSDSTVHVWPGVVDTFDMIEMLAPGDIVLVDWAYDAASAGEMNLVVRPVMEHLLEQDIELVVVSQLPGGPAVARRLISDIERERRGGARAQIQLEPIFVDAGFLPGGVATLPLLGLEPERGLPERAPGEPERPIGAAVQDLAARKPALSLILTFRAEDGQRWIEQVQTINERPALAITSAAADPGLRPYWDSGQISGLVSGYDGALSYASLRQRPSAVSQRSLWRQMVGHAWALVILLIVIAFGNLTALVERRLP